MKRTNERREKGGRGGEGEGRKERGKGGQQFVRANIAADNCHKQQHTLKRKTKEEFVGWKRNDGRIFGGGGGGEEKREEGGEAGRKEGEPERQVDDDDERRAEREWG
ncbi:hypothetical protein niasHT_009295 [Heterodera trifolii]|uniref:Uncharacterized protein n=1 Tax=Heterodera trifolii TaxID=157864 RepID=A0ABD2MBW3_9BILA